MKALGILLLISGVGGAAVAAAPSPAPTQQASATAERAADSRDKIICKRFLETGSLVRGVRICKTKLEWDQERENIRSQPAIDSCRNRASGGPC